jgi:hypothetical protein
MDSLKLNILLKAKLMALVLILTFSSMNAVDSRIEMAYNLWKADKPEEAYVQYTKFFLDCDGKSLPDLLCAKIGEICCAYKINNDHVVFDRHINYFLLMNPILKDDYFIQYVIDNSPIEECMFNLLKSNKPGIIRNLIQN